MRRLIGSLAVLFAIGCGVGTYRTAPVTGQMQMRLVAEDGGEPFPRWSTDQLIGLEDAIFVDATQVREARLENRPDGARHIVLVLNDEGAQQLAIATREANQGRRLAIVVDGQVVAAPTISTPITTGEAHITVQGDIDQVFDALTQVRR